MGRKEYKGFTIRSGTYDDYIVREISSYKSLEITPEDVVLDIGANIGTFSRTALLAGARRVISVEPDPENFELLHINAPGAEMFCMAAVAAGDERIGVTLYKNRGINKGLHSTVPTRGRDMLMVPTIGWDYLLTTFKPTKIKIDCEGAEYTFLEVDLLPVCVKGLIIEYNLSRKGEQEKAQTKHNEFIYNDWTCVRQPRFHTKAWATLASYRRE
jgi:FkbM family methyltransferase